MKQVNCRTIILEHLEKHGFDGLCNIDSVCCCTMADLGHCGDSMADCVVAHYHAVYMASEGGGALVPGICGDVCQEGAE